MNISIMLKPASSNCNLRCKYCFYNDLSSHREMPSHGMMSEKTLRSTLKKPSILQDTTGLCSPFRAASRCLPVRSFFETARYYS